MHNTKRPKRPHPLRVMVVGCGRAAAAHLKAIDYFEKKKQLVLTAIVDRDQKAIEHTLRERRQGAPKPIVANDSKEILARQDIDICVIATPPRTHAPIGLAALEAGAHLIVEKPLALDRKDAYALCNTAREKNLKIAVGLKFRYIPGVQELKEWLDSGIIGDLLYGSVIVRWGHDQAYYDQAQWFGTWEAEGGALMNQSIHALDLMTWLMGGESVRATAVLARQAHRIEAADLAFGTLELASPQTESLLELASPQAECLKEDSAKSPDQLEQPAQRRVKTRLLNIEGTTNTRPDVNEASFFIRGSKGTLRASLYDGKPSIVAEDDTGRRYEKKLLLSGVKRHIKREGIGILKELGHPMTFLYADFLDAIDDDRTPLVTGEDGCAALENVLSLFYAAKEGRTVDLPLPASFSLGHMKGFFENKEVSSDCSKKF